MKRRMQDLQDHVALSDAARRLWEPTSSVRGYFDLLMISGLHRDALQVLAHLMPKRSAVWWGCLCCWQVHRPQLPTREAAALQAALRWVIDPSEETRRAAEAPGQEAGMISSAGCLALAAFWSGGSMTHPDLPPVPPPEPLTAQVVGGAVVLASVEREPMRYEEHCRQFLGLGIEVAKGRNLWYAQPGALHPAETAS